MKNTFLVGVAAAALLSGIGIASAQTIERPPAAGSAQPAPEMNKSGGAEQKGKAGAAIKAEKPTTNAQAPAPAADNKIKADTKVDTSAKPDKADKAKAQEAQKPDSKTKAQMKSSTDSPKSGTSAQGESKTSGQSESKSSGASAGSSPSSGAKVSLSTEQKTKIRETVIKSSNAPRVSNVNFSISVGTTVPRTVRYVPLPRTVVEIYPEWRGYDYFLVGDQIVVVDPRTLRIVAVLEV
jgi:hypothetical protein